MRNPSSSHQVAIFSDGSAVADIGIAGHNNEFIEISPTSDEPITTSDAPSDVMCDYATSADRMLVDILCTHGLWHGEPEW
jgi:hypothetical protein